MTQPEKSVITDEMRAAIGKQVASATLEVEKTGCRMFARAVGHKDLIYYDEEYAKSKGYRNIVAPPGFLGTPVFNPGKAESTVNLLGGFGIPYSRFLNGGNEYEYIDTICAGDTITSSTKIADFQERTGGMGPMLITIIQVDYKNQDGKLVAIGRNTTLAY